MLYLFDLVMLDFVVYVVVLVFGVSVVLFIF